MFSEKLVATTLCVSVEALWWKIGPHYYIANLVDLWNHECVDTVIVLDFGANVKDNPFSFVSDEAEQIHTVITELSPSMLADDQLYMCECGNQWDNVAEPLAFCSACGAKVVE